MTPMESSSESTGSTDTKESPMVAASIRLDGRQLL